MVDIAAFRDTVKTLESVTDDLEGIDLATLDIEPDLGELLDSLALTADRILGWIGQE